MGKGIKGKICFFNSCKNWGGGEKWHLDMAGQMHQSGYDVVLCAHPASPLFEKAKQNNLLCFPFAISSFDMLNPLKIKHISSFFIKEKVQHLILNLPSDLKVAGLAAKKAGVPDIIYRRGSAIPIKPTLLNKYLFRKVVHRILANSKETKRTINAKGQLVHPDKISVVYNGIDFDLLPPAKKRALKKPFVLGNMGRLVPQKNQQFLLKVMQELLKRNCDVLLKIAGSGALENELKTEINRLGLASKVQLCGHRGMDFMNETDLFVHSSLWEGFGYVLVEAQAAGLPVVAFENSSNPEVVQNEETAVLVPENDVQAFADAVQAFYSDEEKYQGFSNKAKEWSRNQFSMQKSIDSFLAFLQQPSI